MMVSRSTLVRATVVALAAAFMLALASCGTGSGSPADDTATSSADYPDWIVDLYPVPGADLSVIRTVQVNHTAVGGDRVVRLSVDGVDLTAYATETSPGLLEYDPSADVAGGAAPVELDPGEHTATAELLEVEPERFTEGEVDYEVVDVLDTYEWSFTIR